MTANELIQYLLTHGSLNSSIYIGAGTIEDHEISEDEIYFDESINAFIIG